MDPVEQKMVAYIATVQPELEKFASEKNGFLAAVETKLRAMVKAGSLSVDEGKTIYKAASENPATLLNYLDIPSYTHKMGQVSNFSNSSSQTEADPLSQWVFS